MQRQLWPPLPSDSMLIKQEIKGVQDDIQDAVVRGCSMGVCWPSVNGLYLFNGFVVSAHLTDCNALMATPVYSGKGSSRKLTNMNKEIDVPPVSQIVLVVTSQTPVVWNGGYTACRYVYKPDPASGVSPMEGGWS